MESDKHKYAWVLVFVRLSCVCVEVKESRCWNHCDLERRNRLWRREPAGLFGALQWRWCHQGPAKRSRNEHILGYFYIISLEERPGSKRPRIFKEHRCRTSSPPSPSLDFLQLSSQRVSSLSFFWVKVRADFGKLLQSRPPNPVRLSPLQPLTSECPNLLLELSCLNCRFL